MLVIDAHFDGKTIILDETVPLALESGTRLKLRIEPIVVGPATESAAAPKRFKPLNIRISPDLSKAIASDPEFNLEES